MGDEHSIALFDIGSNAVRCLLARLDTRPGFEIVCKERAQTRLGATESGSLRQEAVEATVEVVRNFLRRVADERPRLLAIGTSAVREAPNREGLLSVLRQRTGLNLTILSGTEEAQLGAEAALRSMPIARGVVVDLGGGSLQVTHIDGGRIKQLSSVPLGVARLSTTFLRHDPALSTELHALREQVKAQTHDLLEPAVPGSRMLVSGGTVRMLARLEQRRLGVYRGVHGLPVASDELRALRERLESLTVKQLRRLRGLKPNRADVVLAGAVVLEELLGQTAYPELTVCRTSVREGILWREADRLTR